MNVSAFDATLKVLPKVVQIVGVRFPIYILANAVINRMVIVASLFQSPVRFQFVSVNLGTIQNVFFNNRLEGFLADIRDNFCHHLSVALHHAENNSLVRRATTTPAASGATANVGFINFDLAIERHFIVNLRHVISDLMPHAPSAFVGDAKLPHQFHCRDTVTGSGEHVNGDKPRLQRSTAIFKQSSGCRVDVMPTHSAGKGTSLAQAIPLGFALTRRAFIALTKAAIENMLQAGFIVRELAKKFFQRRPRIHFVRFHASNIHPNHPVRQGDNSE